MVDADTSNDFPLHHGIVVVHDDKFATWRYTDWCPRIRQVVLNFCAFQTDEHLWTKAGSVPRLMSFPRKKMTNGEQKLIGFVSEK
jgi:hypothetical protein